MSFLSAVGKDFKAVFSWLGSTKGQAVVGTGEAVVEAIVPGAAGAITLANSWLSEIIKTETLAAAAGQQSGTGAQKAASVITSITPEVLNFASVNGLPTPTADQISTASTALVTFLNTLGAPVSATPEPTPEA